MATTSQGIDLVGRSWKRNAVTAVVLVATVVILEVASLATYAVAPLIAFAVVPVVVGFSGWATTRLGRLPFS